MDVNPYESPQSFDKPLRFESTVKRHDLLALLVFSAVGFVAIVSGFLYGAVFAGIPYQDPTPAMQASYRFHDLVSQAIVLTGLAMFAIGLVGFMGLGMVAMAAKVLTVLRMSK